MVLLDQGERASRVALDIPMPDGQKSRKLLKLDDHFPNNLSTGALVLLGPCDGAGQTTALLYVLKPLCGKRMQWDPMYRRLKSFADGWLTMSVHLDAFRAHPHAYLIAAKWWVRRRRVRARAQFARLFSHSPNAYRLWILRQERSDSVASPPNDQRSIIAVIDGAAGPAGPAGSLDVAMTLADLQAEALPALHVGSVETPRLSDLIDKINWESEPWLMVLRAGDRIAPGAASAYRAVMGDPDTRVIYADDDLLRGRVRRVPHFKPDWNPELYGHHDYLTGACILRAKRSDLEAVEQRGDWADRLVARIADAGRVQHLPKMLHHRQERPVPALPLPQLAVPQDLPLVSVIVPTRNRKDLLSACLDGLWSSIYPKLQLIVVDNDSDDPETLAYLNLLAVQGHIVLRHPGPFNYSAINNRAVERADGHLLCLLNNDVEVLKPDWLQLLATQAIRCDIGAVGARLLYPDGRIQHAGVVIGVGNAAGHAHRFLDADQEGYFHRHSLPQFTTAVTAGCLVVERHKFNAVGGFNEQDFAVAFNDVDLCLRLNQRGWQSFYEPRATLIHHESVSRGLDMDPAGAARFASELQALQRLWGTNRVTDPYHHPHLSRASEQFVVAL